jgi:hypothetical protein
MECERGRLVAKLRSARERKREETGNKIGDRKSHAELWPELGAEGRVALHVPVGHGANTRRDYESRRIDAHRQNPDRQHCCPWPASRSKGAISASRRQYRRVTGSNQAPDTGAFMRTRRRSA